MSNDNEFWRQLYGATSEPEQVLPRKPTGVEVKLGDNEPVPVDVIYRGRRDGLYHWAAVVPWPKGTPLPPGSVEVLIGELPAHTQVNVQVRWI